MFQIQPHIFDVIRTGNGSCIAVESDGGGIDAAVVFAAGQTVGDKHPLGGIHTWGKGGQHHRVGGVVADAEVDLRAGTDGLREFPL